ncbi:MAG: archease [Nitrospira sp. SB0673_bin_12]|nr:archease [Nitrospira sp. SB0673_bin_12]
MGKAHRFLDEIVLGDLAFEATGNSVSELFAAAGLAVIEVMADPLTVETNWTKDCFLSESELEDLFFEWLNSIVFIKDVEGVVFHKVHAMVRQDSENNLWHLDATLTGDRVDAARQDLRTDVKAVTKHLFEIRHDESGWYARAVLDL